MARLSMTPGNVHPELPGNARMCDQAAARPNHVAQCRLTCAPSAHPGLDGLRAGLRVKVERLP
jgi:hypothetical protein